MNELIIILSVLSASIGMMLYFVGWINIVFMNLGKKDYIMAASLFIISPLAILYCIKDWDETKTQGKQMIIGLLIFFATALPAYWYIKSMTIEV